LELGLLSIAFLPRCGRSKKTPQCGVFYEFRPWPEIQLRITCQQERQVQQQALRLERQQLALQKRQQLERQERVQLQQERVQQERQLLLFCRKRTEQQQR
jgi:hypothetical protein